MGLTSNTGLLSSVPEKNNYGERPEHHRCSIELRCEVMPAPFILRPYAGLYNPFSQGCSVLCNHPAGHEARQFLKRAKEKWLCEGKPQNFSEDLSKLQDGGLEKDKYRTPHDIVTEDMFRRYTETDSRPLTPAPTLASGKSRGSRRCLTPDQPHNKTAIVLDLRRSHSQETLYYHGYSTSDITGGHNTSPTNDGSTLPSLNLMEGGQARLGKGQCEQLPPLASPLILTKRATQMKDQKERDLVKAQQKKNQLRALNLGTKLSKTKKQKGDQTPSRGSKGDKDSNEGDDGTARSLANTEDTTAGEVRRRGKRRRKGRVVGSDRLTSSAGLAQAQQDPETQIAGIGTDSHNPSSRASIAPVNDDILPIAVNKTSVNRRKTDSFLDDDILKFLHREVDEEAIETEFDAKRRYVLEEALRTRPDRPPGQEMQALLRDYKVPTVSLGDWLHIPRVFSRRNATFSLPIDTNALENITPMQYAARYVTLKKSKQLLYLTVLRKFSQAAYVIPVKDLEEALVLMMGGALSEQQARQFKLIMEWDDYVDEDMLDEFRLTGPGYRRECGNGDDGESEENSLRYRTWCGLCAICERLYGRLPSREKDLPDGMELSDFTSIDAKLTKLKIHKGLLQVLTAIRLR